MRFNRSSCDKCLDVCPVKAIWIDDQGLHIDRDACTGCMLCNSICPADGLSIQNFNFQSVLAKLKDLQSPVLSCHVVADNQAHIKIPCLGLLSETHLAVMSILAEAPVQLNLTACKKCVNGVVVNKLQKSLFAVAAKLMNGSAPKIKLIEEKADLHFRPISYTRRGFFDALRHMDFPETIGYSGGLPAGDKPKAYADKAVPDKIKMLNKILPMLPETLKNWVYENYYYHLRVDSNCDLCLSCVMICPTGALKIGGDGSTGKIVFSSAFCNGCNLCAEFCSKNSIDIIKGFSGKNPSAYASCEAAT
ncbi:MAG TPA: 4Fe-4S dicluster domain-containing protein [bacterium]|nr:4Fe-4S dicluster domain-containing protein [bacterium]